MAGGGAGGDAPDTQASALGLPYGQPQPPKRLSPSWDTTNHGGVQREVSIQVGRISAIVEDERRTVETIKRVRMLVSERPSVCLFTHDPINLARLGRMFANN